MKQTVFAIIGRMLHDLALSRQTVSDAYAMEDRQIKGPSTVGYIGRRFLFEDWYVVLAKREDSKYHVD